MITDKLVGPFFVSQLMSVVNYYDINYCNILIWRKCLITVKSKIWINVSTISPTVGTTFKTFNHFLQLAQWRYHVHFPYYINLH